MTRRLIESCAAVLAPLLPADADRDQFLHMVAVHDDAVAAKRAIEKALRTGVGVDDPYGYSRAFSYQPRPNERLWPRRKGARPTCWSAPTP